MFLRLLVPAFLCVCVQPFAEMISVKDGVTSFVTIKNDLVTLDSPYREGSKVSEYPACGWSAAVDVSRSLYMMDRLSGTQVSADELMGLLSDAGSYAPPVWMKAGALLVQIGKAQANRQVEELGFKFFYGGQVRARADYMLMRSPEGDGVTALTEIYGPVVNQAFLGVENRAKNIAFMKDVEAFERVMPFDYDRRWLALYDFSTLKECLTKTVEGMKGGASKAEVKLATKTEQQIYKPRAEWQKTTEDARKHYFEGFYESMKTLDVPEGLPQAK